jgi:hypothetical protein
MTARICLHFSSMFRTLLGLRIRGFVLKTYKQRRFGVHYTLSEDVVSKTGSFTDTLCDTYSCCKCMDTPFPSFSCAFLLFFILFFQPRFCLSFLPSFVCVSLSFFLSALFLCLFLPLFLPQFFFPSSLSSLLSVPLMKVMVLTSVSQRAQVVAVARE